MGSVVSFNSYLRADSIAQPSLKLRGSEAVNSSPVALQVPAQSSKTAVMACLTPTDCGNSELLRKAHRAALENGGEFYAVLSGSRRSRFAKAQVRTLLDDAILASYLGAKIVWLESSDVVGDLLQLARQSQVGRIFVTRNQPARFFRPFGSTVYCDLLRRSEGIRIDVVGFERGN
jgi:K+-sensing histidine kinase KdpD